MGSIPIAVTCMLTNQKFNYISKSQVDVHKMLIWSPRDITGTSYLFNFGRLCTRICKLLCGSYWSYKHQCKLSTTHFSSSIFFGLTDTTFKERYRNHKRNFEHEKYENITELAKYIWQLKRDNISFSVKWTIITKVYGNSNLLLCKLCLTL